MASTTYHHTIESLRTSFNGFVRRMSHLPLSIMGRIISRATGYAAQNRNQGLMAMFEAQFGRHCPFFYECQFSQAVWIARDECKLVFVYLHDPETPHTASFICGTLCSSLVVEFIDTNFVSWGAVAGEGEGLLMAMAMRATTFPFCAVAAPAESGDGISILRQVEGPVSPEELIEILQKTIEEQGFRASSLRAQEEEARKRTREELDAAYQASLEMDKDKDEVREVLVEDGDLIAEEIQNNAQNKMQRISLSPKQPINRNRKASKETIHKETVASKNIEPFTKIAIRFPNGERKEQRFHSTDTIWSIYMFIDSLEIPGIGAYQLISNFPRKVFGYEQLKMTLRDAGLHPNAALFLELLH